MKLSAHILVTGANQGVGVPDQLENKANAAPQAVDGGTVGDALRSLFAPPQSTAEFDVLIRALEGVEHKPKFAGN